MHFSSSGVGIFPLISFAVALRFSCFSSMGGVTGAFLPLPYSGQWPYEAVKDLQKTA